MLNGIVVEEKLETCYVIHAESVSETRYVEAKNLTEQQALSKIADYLKNATEFLRKKRLEAAEQ